MRFYSISALPGVIHMQRSSRIGECDVILLEAAEYLKVDRLLRVHVDVIIGVKHKIDNLEIKAGGSGWFKVRAVDFKNSYAGFAAEKTETCPLLPKKSCGF